MLVTTTGQQTLWETILPPGYQDLPAELVAVDALLDDPAFFEPYRAHFSPLWGRPSIPIETYLRMMVLKHRYGLPRQGPGRPGERGRGTTNDLVRSVDRPQRRRFSGRSS